MEPSQLGSLKGLNRDKGHERVYTSLAPYGEGKAYIKLGWYRCFDDQEARHAMPGSRRVVSCPQPPVGRPLIYTGGCPVAYRVPAGL